MEGIWRYLRPDRHIFCSQLSRKKKITIALMHQHNSIECNRGKKTNLCTRTAACAYSCYLVLVTYLWHCVICTVTKALESRKTAFN